MLSDLGDPTLAAIEVTSLGASVPLLEGQDVMIEEILETGATAYSFTNPLSVDQLVSRMGSGLEELTSVVAGGSLSGQAFVGEGGSPSTTLDRLEEAYAARGHVPAIQQVATGGSQMTNLRAPGGSDSVALSTSTALEAPGASTSESGADEGPWPTAGSVTASELGSSTRRITSTMRWSDATTIDRFYNNAYEHDVKLKNLGGCPATGPTAFWARRENVVVTTNFPHAAREYFDTAALDDCDELDFTVGVYFPQELQPDVNYFVDVWADAGTAATSELQLVGESLHKICYGHPLCVNVAPPGLFLESELYVGETRGTAPGCRQWDTEADESRPCTPFTSLDSRSSEVFAPDGHLFVAYLDPSQNNSLVAAKCSDAACTAPTSNIISIFAQGRPSVSFGPDDLPLIAYDTHDRSLVIHCLNPQCSQHSTPVPVVQHPGFGPLDLNVLRTSAGLPVIVSRLSSPPSFSVDYCADIACSSISESRRLLTSESSQREYAVAMGSDNSIIFGYTPVSAAEAGVFQRCYNQCSMVSSAISLGFKPTSIIVNTLGRPLIVGQEGGSSGLSLVAARYCSDITCTGGPTKRLLAGGSNASAAFGGDGMPLVAFGQSYDLHVLRC